jgi:hypothetical protein
MPHAISNPEIVDELRRLAARKGGELRPIDVVDAARLKRSPLHDQFDWDDTEAAERWRLHQARNLLRVVVAFEPVDEDKRIECRVFISLTPDRESGVGYRVMHTVLSDPEQRKQLLDDARAEMKRFITKYRKLDELAAVFAAMDKLLD